ncbi:MAG: GNAT family N-acetyltransferase [Chloroflexi bacterium]|nr:GNAT family N-acetyltransferase [Chloroflexota bacterium]
MSEELIIFNKFDHGLEKLWNNFDSKKENPFLNYSINKIWYDIFGKGTELKIITDKINFIAPMLIKEDIAYFCGGKDLFDYHNFVYKDTIHIESIKSVLNQLFIEESVNKIELNSIVEESQLHKTLLNFQNEYDFEFIDEDVSPMINLPESFHEYLSNLSKKNRHEIRRKIRKFEKNFEFKIVNANDENINKLLVEFIKLMKLNPEKKLFLNSDRVEFMNKVIKDSILNDRGELSFIEIDGDLISTSFSFKNNHKLFVYNSGFNNDYSEYSVGLMNHVYNIKNKIGNYNVMDFLRGNEEYKYRIGCKNRNLLTITVKKK